MGFKNLVLGLDGFWDAGRSFEFGLGLTEDALRRSCCWEMTLGHVFCFLRPIVSV